MTLGRALPAVERVVADLDGLPHGLLVRCAREALDDARRRISDDAAGAPAGPAEVIADARRRVEQVCAGLLRPVLNATGVLLHTNLGRAPLGLDALAAATRIGGGYSNLEYRICGRGSGGRATRTRPRCWPGPAARRPGSLVNNNAAAVLVALAALARGREVIVSRGELVEIGGGFRVPEVMAESGPVSSRSAPPTAPASPTTRRRAGADTALILKVHASNYRMIGFTESTPVGELAGLGPAGHGRRRVGAARRDDALARPAASGVAATTSPACARPSTPARRSSPSRATSCWAGRRPAWSLGRADLVAACARHPLARAVRAGKLTLAALQAVALAYLAATRPDPALAHGDRVARRAAGPRRAGRARASTARRCVDTRAVAGGGSLPGLTIPSVGVASTRRPPTRSSPRCGATTSSPGSEDGTVVCDLRTVDPADDERLATRWPRGPARR